MKKEYAPTIAITQINEYGVREIIDEVHELVSANSNEEAIKMLVEMIEIKLGFNAQDLVILHH